MTNTPASSQDMERRASVASIDVAAPIDLKDLSLGDLTRIALREALPGGPVDPTDTDDSRSEVAASTSYNTRETSFGGAIVSTLDQQTASPVEVAPSPSAYALTVGQYLGTYRSNRVG